MPGAGDPQDLNRYSYAASNALRYTDPTGHYYYDPGCDCLVYTGRGDSGFNENPDLSGPPVSIEALRHRPRAWATAYAAAYTEEQLGIKPAPGAVPKYDPDLQARGASDPYGPNDRYVRLGGPAFTRAENTWDVIATYTEEAIHSSYEYYIEDANPGIDWGKDVPFPSNEIIIAQGTESKVYNQYQPAVEIRTKEYILSLNPDVSATYKADVLSGEMGEYNRWLNLPGGTTYYRPVSDLPAANLVMIR